MINQEQKQFATHVLAELLPQLASKQGDPIAFVTQLSTQFPNIQVAQFRGREMTKDVWDRRVASVIVDHYAENYDPAKLRATG